MTTVFVSEYVCGGGGRPAGERPWAAPLFAEGRAMLTAALDDFARIPGVGAVTVVDQELAPHILTFGRVLVAAPQDEERRFRSGARLADWTLVIAPEFDDILETRCRWVEEEGGRLLGPSPWAVSLTADKLKLARHLETFGVPAPQTVETRKGRPSCPPPWVVKPRDGAGSQHMRRIDSPGQLTADLYFVRGTRETLVQPFVPGLAACVAFLVGPRQAITLDPAEQLLSADGTFQYLGGRLPLPDPLARRARRIAQLAVAAVPGLFGYVGVDVVLGDAEDGSQDMVIEINPRLTTSYVGLRHRTTANLAELMLRLAADEEVKAPRWLANQVAFTADGEVTIR